VEVEDTVHLLARHGTVMASYSLNQHQAPNEMTMTIICERGTARFEAHRSRWQWMTEPGDEWREGGTQRLERDTLFIAQAALFLDAVEGKIPPPCPLEDGAQSLRVNQAALASLTSGRWTEVAQAIN
jgi:predicted dehydrogenase